ncbi:hypothetical protein [Halorarius halobius]|uniref:hypothetical protein n=1 Tax=Halorarius halobius TaxID=2962671 RepID=UPI0020CFA56B|nr:hypothetical protein [Halorarius halobius]
MSPLPSDLTRRTLLRATGGGLGVAAVGTAAGGTVGDCPDATRRPAMRHCETAATAACADGHPETVRLRRRVERSLERRYATVGSLIEQGFVPYFDVLRTETGGYSHWLKPGYIGNGSVVDPERPEAVLVDNRWWRPIGVMFVATDAGEALGEVPTVYEDDDERCSPWHHHVGLPGRFAWWSYEKARAIRRADDGVPTVPFPCRTPCMMHVWTYPNPKGVYAHHPPPQENRGGPPAEDAGFDTWATPGEDVLDWDCLPDDVVEEARPDSLPAAVDASALAEEWRDEVAESGLLDRFGL